MPHRIVEGMFRYGPTGLVVSGLDGRIESANEAFADMVGRSPEDLVGMAFLDLTHPDDRAGSRTVMDALEDGGEGALTAEQRYLRADGTVRWGRLGVALIRDERGVALRTAATIEDITEQREAEQALARTRELLALSQDIGGVGAWELDVTTMTQTWTEAVHDILELPVGTAVPSVDETLDRYGPQGRARLWVAFEGAIEHGRPFDLQLRVKTFAGRTRWVRIVAQARRSGATVDRVVGAFHDITELRTARTEAEQTADQLVTTLESMTDAVFMLDDTERFTYLNPNAETVLQRHREELLGRVVWDEFPEVVGSEVYEAYVRAMRDQVPVTVEEYYYPPLETWVDVRAFPADGGIVVYFRDISWRVAARQELEARAERLADQAALIDEAPDAIVVTDLDGLVTFWSRGAEGLYGWSASQATGRPLAELTGMSAAEGDEPRRRVLAEGQWAGEVPAHDRAGTPMDVAARVSLLHHPDGSPRAALHIHTDVTAQRRLERQVVRAERMQSLGTLASGIAHDLNNVLVPIMMGLDIVRDAPAEARDELVTTMKLSAQRGRDLIAKIMDFARGHDGALVPVDIAALVGEVATIARDTFPAVTTLDTDVPSGLPRVGADPTRLHQVLMNLVINARDAMPDGGTIRCTARTETIDQDTSHLPELGPGTYVSVAISDTGHGIPPDTLDQIFDPFFTTKPKGHGTGLGLSTVLGIVRSLGGHIDVHSEPSLGTTIRILFPVVT